MCARCLELLEGAGENQRKDTSVSLIDDLKLLLV